MRILLTFLMIAFLSGCAVNRMEAQVFPGQDLNKINSVHVVKLPRDDRGVNQLITDKFTAFGKKATTGTATDAPAEVDAIITYADKWMWDITMYMVELTVVIEEPKEKFPIAKGYSIHTSLTRRSPEEMVDEVVTNIFKEQAK